MLEIVGGGGSIWDRLNRDVECSVRTGYAPPLPLLVISWTLCVSHNGLNWSINCVQLGSKAQHGLPCHYVG